MSHVDIMTYYAAIPSSYERVFCYFSADRLFFYCLFSFCSVGVVMRFGYWESWHAIKVLKAGHLVSCRVCVCVRVYVYVVEGLCVVVCRGEGFFLFFSFSYILYVATPKHVLANYTHPTV